MQRAGKTRATHRHGPKISQDRDATIRDGMLGQARLSKTKLVLATRLTETLSSPSIIGKETGFRVHIAMDLK